MTKRHKNATSVFYSTSIWLTFYWIATDYLSELWSLFRSSNQSCSVRKGVPRNLEKFTGKHLCQSLFFNKFKELKPAILLKKRLWHRCFPVSFDKFLRTPFFLEHLWWLLLSIYTVTFIPNKFSGTFIFRSTTE